MKLELKHLAAYLPYNLKLTRNGFIGYLIAIINDEDSITECFEFKVSCSNWWENNTDKNHYKPILRPLSDLTKEIKVNGDKFIPNCVLNARFVSNTGNLVPYRWLNCNLELEIHTEEYSQTIDLFDGFLIVQQLLEWHFDIYGLIDAGLAIDINTL